MCAKVFKEKRPKFDTSKVRNAEIIQEMEKLEGFAKHQYKQKKNIKEQPSSTSGNDRPLKKIPKWKKESEQFRKALRAGKGKDELTG